LREDDRNSCRVDVERSLENEHLRLAVFHSAEMLVALEKEYDARWNSELRGPA
jgi:hypothetical protein